MLVIHSYKTNFLTNNATNLKEDAVGNQLKHFILNK